MTDFFRLDDRVFFIAEKHQIRLKELFDEMSFDKWRKGVDLFFSACTYGKILERADLLRRVYTNEAPRNKNMDEVWVRKYEYFLVKVACAEVISDKNKESFEKLQKCFCDYAEKCLAFYEKFFKLEAFSGEMEMLPPECRVAVKIFCSVNASSM